ncbi:hypothetical protein Emtol_4052 [Emticicia oligotrophica DSM 17448]|uniref:DUF4842 domain-containing protein n=2 Tax=Emticicia TaxID=312278 RepID=A0ABN4ATS9_EMTOG|nr:LruC domain-containing protein [Emticicia oligotrophica]AFK05177.1 hypothetical protein Emtol_4052 [Emticicia oligotrophica DSM 17448]
MVKSQIVPLLKRTISIPSLLAFSIVFVLSGCLKTDLERQVVASSPKLFSSDVVIPADFNWSTTKTMDFKVAVDDKFSGKYFYRVELYDNDPMLGTQANLLSAGVAKKGQDFTGKIVVPTMLNYIYVKRISPTKVPFVTMIPVEKMTNLSISLNGAINTGMESVRVATDLSKSNTLAPKFSYSVADYAVPAGAIEIKADDNNVKIESNKTYVVKAGVSFKGNIDLNNGTSNVKVYIDGEWHDSNNALVVGGNNTLIITENGSININKLTQNTGGTFINCGKAEFDNMTTSNESTYSNYGTLKAKKAVFTNASLKNYGTITFEDLTSTTTSTLIRNEGSMYVEKGLLTNSTLETLCYIKIKDLLTNGAKIKIEGGGMLSVDTYQSGGTEFNLLANAILEVTEIVKFTSNSNVMKGPASSGRALARMKEVDVKGQWNAITYKGNLEIACSKHTANEQWKTYYVIESPATIVPFDKSTVVIPGTTCNGGGNKGPGDDKPEDQVVTEVNLGTYSYAFEDNWPQLGDYDLNDVVVDMNVVKFQNTSNKVTKVVLKGKLRAAGALKRLAVAVQLDGILANSVSKVTYSRADLVGSLLKLGANGVETGQKFAVATIADDVHKAFGLNNVGFVNTQTNNYAPVDVVITIEFTTPLDSFTFQTLNMFIVNYNSAGNDRGEVHLVGYKGTDKIDALKIANSTGSLLSNTDPFKSINNEPWGLIIPSSFVYPPETKNIKTFYTKFQSWATSGGTVDTNWYLQ